MIFVPINIAQANDDELNLLKRVKLNTGPSRLPALFIFHFGGQSITDYQRYSFSRTPDQMSLPTVDRFINEFKEGRLKPDLKNDFNVASEGPVQFITDK